jgi:hypothetical protein
MCVACGASLFWAIQNEDTVSFLELIFLKKDMISLKSEQTDKLVIL